MYKFLSHEVAKCMQGDSTFYDDSLLNIRGDSWILIIHSDAVMIYGHMWSSENFEEIKKGFDLSKFSNYLIIGDSLLIKALLEFYEIDNFIIEMERVFYRANSITLFDTQDLEISSPEEIDINPLASMLQQYYHEEYDGENDKSLEEMKSRIQTCISKKAIYVLKNGENNILSFCTLIDPDIGIFFTKAELRNKGYGKIILSYCSDILLQQNEEIYLMTVKSKAESNAACQRVGFRQFYEYSYIRINNS
jgi:hypothetical protein